MAKTPPRGLPPPPQVDATPVIDENRAMARLMFERIHRPAEAAAKTLLARKHQVKSTAKRRKPVV